MSARMESWRVAARRQCAIWAAAHVTAASRRAAAVRAAVWSLAFVFLVERLLGTALSGIAQWSPMWESRAVYTDLADGIPDDLIRDGIPVGSGAVVRLCLIAAIALAVSRWRLAHLRIAGAAD